MQDSDALGQKTVRCRLGRAADVTDRQAIEYRLGDGDWPLRVFAVRCGDAIRVYRNRCPHLGWPLNVQPDRFLTPDESLVVCAGHGALFEKDTGRCVGGPCPGSSLAAYPVEIDAADTITIVVPRAHLDNL